MNRGLSKSPKRGQRKMSPMKREDVSKNTKGKKTKTGKSKITTEKKSSVSISRRKLKSKTKKSPSKSSPKQKTSSSKKKKKKSTSPQRSKDSKERKGAKGLIDSNHLEGDRMNNIRDYTPENETKMGYDKRTDRYDTSPHNNEPVFKSPQLLPEVSKVKYSIQFDKKVGTMRDVKVDTEPHLLFENIHDLYNEDGDLEEKYKNLLQLNRNRGAEEKLNAVLPKYNEIEFFDKIPVRSNDTSPRKKTSKVVGVHNEQLYDKKYEAIFGFGDISKHVTIRDINYSFYPKIMRLDDVLRVIVDLLEERSKMQTELKTKGLGKGIHQITYFDFSRFCLDYFIKKYPSNLKRQKLIINFLWTLVIHDKNEMVGLFSDILKKKLGITDLLNLMMVKDFVKLQLSEKIKQKPIDFASLCNTFQQNEDLINLSRRIVSNYEESFRNFFELKFMDLKGDDEFMNMFDFIALVTRTFRELEEQGLVGVTRRVDMISPKRQGDYYEGKGLTNHMLKCYGLFPHRIGSAHDRSKSKDHVKWFMWSDYPKKSSDKQRELTSKEIGEFFSVEMNDRMERIRELSTQKKKTRYVSPVPYQNLTERTKRIIDELEIEVVKTSKPHISSLKYNSGDKYDNYSKMENLTSSQMSVYNEQKDLEIFNTFENMKLKSKTQNLNESLIPSKMNKEEKEITKQPVQGVTSVLDPQSQQQIVDNKKMETIHTLLREDLSDKLQEMLNKSIKRVREKDPRKGGSEVQSALHDIIEVKISAMVDSIFNDRIDGWFGALQIQESEKRQSDIIEFETIMRRFRELQRTPFDRLHVGLVQQLTNSILDQQSLRSMIREVVSSRVDRI